MMSKQCTGKSFSFLHMLSLNIRWKTWSASLSRPAWWRAKTAHNYSKQVQGKKRNFASELWLYLHEKLWAFGHEQLDDEGRREARDGAEDHKQPPALKVYEAQREMGPCFWNDQPSQACQQRRSLRQRFCRFHQHREDAGPLAAISPSPLAFT